LDGCVSSILLQFQVRDVGERNPHRRGVAAVLHAAEIHDLAAVAGAQLVDGLIRCGDGSLYTGIATDVERRFGEHVSQGPKAAKYLRGRLPLEIVYRKEIGSRSDASKEEVRIKRLGVKGKVGLVNGD
jgi:putative endonuclease